MVAIAKRLDRTAAGREFLSRATPGRPTMRLVGSYIDELAMLGKAIVLTPDEARKFDHVKYGYATNPNMPRVRGHSDASGDWCAEALLFLKKD